MQHTADTQAPLSAEELKPCPFCGSAGDELMLFCDPEEGRDNSGPSRRIQCAGCNIEAPFYDTEAEAIQAWNRRALPSSEPSGAAEGEHAALALLIHRFYMAEIGRLMQQAEHWAQNEKPAAVHHRLQKADAYFQVANLFDPRQVALGWPDPFKRMADDLASAPIKPPGAYPYSRELHRYNDVHFVSAELKRLTTPAAPASAPGAGEAELRAALEEAIEFADQDAQALTPLGEAMIARWRAALATHSPSATASGGGEALTVAFAQALDEAAACIHAAASRIGPGATLPMLLDWLRKHAPERYAALRPAQNPQPEGETVEGQG